MEDAQRLEGGREIGRETAQGEDRGDSSSGTVTPREGQRPAPVLAVPFAWTKREWADVRDRWNRIEWRRVDWFKIVWRTVAGIFLLLFALWAILYITKGRFLKHPFESIATSLSGRQVKVAGDFQFYFNPINLKFLAEGLSVANPDWRKGNLFEARLIDTDTRTLSFIWGPRQVKWIELKDAKVDLAWDKSRTRNTWTFGGGEGKPLDLPVILRAKASGTQILYDDPQMQLDARIGVQTAEARDSRFAEAIRFDGGGHARGTPFTLTGALFSPNATVAGGRTSLGLVVRAVDARAEITGTLPAPTVLDGADLKADLRGRNLANLFLVAGIAVPDTRRYHLRSDFTKNGAHWDFTRLRGTFGDSDLAGKLTITMGGPRLKLESTLHTRSLDIIDVAPFIGYNPDLIAAKGAAGAVKQVDGTPHLLPDAPLRVEALRNFDADVRYTVGAVKSRAVPISDIDLTLGLDNSLLKLSPLKFTMARGTVNADIAINARKAPVVTDYDIRLSPTPMGRLLAGWGVEESGTTGTLSGRVKMTGVGNSVRDSLAHSNGRIAIVMPAGTMWARNIQLSEIDIGTFITKMFEGKLKEPVEINCGLIAFTVRDGIGAADPILIDTKKNVILGRGGFSFRTEAIDMAIRADGKKFSLFSGQSPVGLDGYFARPGLKVISPELLGRAGASIGLGVFATPVAAILPFIDIGDAKSAACGPVLEGARASAQRTTKGKPRDDVGNGTTGKSESGKRSPDEKRDQAKKFGK